MAKMKEVIFEYSVRNKSGEDIPVYSVTNEKGFCTDYFSKEVASKDRTTYKIVPRGYFAYNPSRINVGSIGWQNHEDRVIVSPLYVVFGVSKYIDQQYLLHYFKSDRMLTLIKEYATGSVRDNLKLSILGEFPIKLRPIDEQRKIAAILDKIGDLIAKRHQQLDKLDEMVKARFVEMFGDVIQNTKLWPQYIFSDITTSRLGKMLDAKQQTGMCQYPYLANFNVQWFRFELDNLNEMDFNEADRIEFELRDGDLLVCEGGEIGRCAVWHNEIQPCYFQKALHRVRCKKEIVLPDYLAWWFKYNCDNKGFAAIEGAKATISHLPGAKLKALLVSVPPIEQQKQFATFVEQTEKTKNTISRSLEKLETLKKALMQEYFG